MQGERIVGGLACSAVLALLPEVVAGTIGAGDRAKVALHLAGCSVCERFGGAYGATVRALRASANGEEDRAAKERLLAKLAKLPARSPARE